MSSDTVKPMPAIVPAPATAAQPTGGRIRPRLSRGDQPGRPGGPERLADHVADQDAQRDRRGEGRGQEAAALITTPALASANSGTMR